MTPHLERTRLAYDTVAADYARLLPALEAEQPPEVAFLATFAETVRPGRVGDLGCGTGRVAAHLAGHGLDVFGLDLSAGMVAIARERHPGLPFGVASLTALPLAGGSLTGALAWYSIVHTPPAVLPTILAELHRVLAPGGHLLLAFHAGGTSHRNETAYGHPVPLDWHLPDPDRLAADLATLGLPVTARLVRAPVAPERFPQAFLLARKA
ncbi:class I SAM-dependent methyltransferase [Dactylosporangium sp. NBC_01737]|uniref:class I SAM-dependent DNA methyltransferase n=1 Tax=Dactylosporangium sp. NBC_01737 TaxID=2975959 RepID=UPI002E1525F9|nr:class I SAM-dependent methyltransferase [Dactylosporangium sp. NBC_01737]